MHPKNSTTSAVVQLPVLLPVDFGACAPNDERLFRIRDDVPLMDGLDLAQSLAEGIYQLSSKVADEVNHNGSAQLSELRALAFLADTVQALTFSAKCAILKQEEDQ